METKTVKAFGKEAVENPLHVLDIKRRELQHRDVEIIQIQQVNEAFERLEKGDVKYRFVIDMASLKSNN